MELEAIRIGLAHGLVNRIIGLGVSSFALRMYFCAIDVQDCRC